MFTKKLVRSLRCAAHRNCGCSAEFDSLLGKKVCAAKIRQTKSNPGTCSIGAILELRPDFIEITKAGARRARATLNDLIRQYPGTDAARRATDQLQSIKLDRLH